jgi:hypothetical protein
VTPDPAHKHRHECPECGRTWECFLPGGCREEVDQDCTYCRDDEEEEDEG